MVLPFLPSCAAAAGERVHRTIKDVQGRPTGRLHHRVESQKMSSLTSYATSGTLLWVASLEPLPDDSEWSNITLLSTSILILILIASSNLNNKVKGTISPSWQCSG